MSQRGAEKAGSNDPNSRRFPKDPPGETGVLDARPHRGPQAGKQVAPAPERARGGAPTPTKARPGVPKARRSPHLAASVAESPGAPRASRPTTCSRETWRDGAFGQSGLNRGGAGRCGIRASERALLAGIPRWQVLRWKGRSFPGHPASTAAGPGSGRFEKLWREGRFLVEGCAGIGCSRREPPLCWRKAARLEERRSWPESRLD